MQAVRASRALDALAALVGAGYAQEGFGIVRSLLEEAVSLAYISESAGTRAEDWFAFASKRAEARLKANGFPDGRTWWSGKSPKKMTEALQSHAAIASEFASLYPRLCDDTHSSPIAAVNYVVGTDSEGGLPSLLAGPSSHRVAEVSALGAMMAARVCQVAAELGVELDMLAITQAASEVATLYNESNV